MTHGCVCVFVKIFCSAGPPPPRGPERHFTSRCLLPLLHLFSSTTGFMRVPLPFHWLTLKTEKLVGSGISALTGGPLHRPCL